MFIQVLAIAVELMSQPQSTTTTPQLVARGFSLVELVVAAAIIAMVGAGTLAAIAFFEQTTVDSSNAKASKNLLTNMIDEAHSVFTEDLEGFNTDVIDNGNTALTTSSRGISSDAFINAILGDADRFDGQNPECAIESANLTDKTFTLDSDCPSAAFNSLEVLNSTDEPAPLHIIGAPSICAVHRVTSASRMFHLCPDTDACSDTVATTDCIPTDGDGVIVGSEVLMPRFLIRESDTANTGDPVAYLVESAGVTGPSQITLVVDDDYYDSFENSTLTDACSGGTCKVPVQESVARNINPDRKIRVTSDSLAAYTQDVTVTITATDTSGDPALGSLSVSTGTDFLTDSDGNDHVLTIEGPLIELNDTLETLSYTGDTGIFEEVDVNIAMTFGSLEQSTGPDADNVAADIRLEVYPNCGCEPEGRTAVTFRLGKWDTANSTFLSQPSLNLPMDITTVALRDSQTPVAFYGYSTSGSTPYSSKQNSIAASAALTIYILESTSTDADVANGREKFSMFFQDDEFGNSCDGGPDSGDSGAYGATDYRDGIEAGRGTTSNSSQANTYSTETLFRYDATNDSTDNPTQVSTWSCRAAFDMDNVPAWENSNYPFIERDEDNDFRITKESFNHYAGNNLSTFSSWGGSNSIIDGGNGRADGFVLALKVSNTTPLQLSNYVVPNNPRFRLTWYNSFQQWRIRQVRLPSIYPGGTCPASLPAENNDENAWLDYSDDVRLSIPKWDWDGNNPTWFSPPEPASNMAQIINRSTDTVELRVQTAKTCPDPDIFGS